MPSPAPERDEHDRPTGLPELDDLWAWGATTSRAMAERVSDMYRNLGSSMSHLAPPELDADLGQLRLDAERLADLSFDVFDRLLTVVGSIVDGTDGQGRGQGRGRDEVCLGATAGETASTDVWVHNVSTDAHPAPRLYLPGLASADGITIPEHAICLTAADEPIDAGNSRRFTLAVEIPAGTPSGAYHGVLISDASIDTARLVRLDVGD
ncbi:MAG TPA: hypothetical protein VFZ17_03830 [Acidimicrobiia bacterium]|nr:hypothetical protein [Acidimicrobiia bacterium]